MIDIHPTHHGSFTLRDFFIHLGIVVLGILIAIGLEQTVEYIHHRHQVAETRQALVRERDSNRAAYAVAVHEFQRQDAAMVNNLIVLRYLEQHPGTPANRLPGILIWHAMRSNLSDSAWNTAQQSDVTVLMPQNEVRTDAHLYDRIEAANRGFDLIWPVIVQARLYALENPDPSHLTPAQVAKEIEFCHAVLTQHYVEGAALVQLSRTDPTFVPALSPNDLNSLMHVASEENDPALASAIALTNNRLPPSSRLPIPEQHR